MKSRRTQIAAVLLALALIAPGTLAVTSETAAAQPTEIGSCTVIDESGQYVLTQDLSRSNEGDDACLEVRASDVVLRGGGHTLDGGYGTGVRVTSVRNVTIADLTVRENVYNVRLEGATDVRIANVTSRSPDPTGGGIAVADARQVEIKRSDLSAGGAAGAAVAVDRSERVAIVNNSFSQGNRAIEATGTNESAVIRNNFADVEYAVDIERGAANVIANNTIENRPQLGIDVGGHDNVVTGNAITLAYNGIEISGSNNTIADNDVSRIEEWAVAVQGSSHTIAKNRLSGGEGASRSGGALELVGANHAVAANTLGGVHGIYAKNAIGTVSVTGNHFSGTYHVRVAEMNGCTGDSGGAAAIELRGNAFAAGGSVTNDYGVLNEDDAVLNATNNYWGDEGGPSSPDGENVTDPITGTAADGGGAPVSEGVHFDPWLRGQPAT